MPAGQGGVTGAFHHHRALWIASDLQDTAHLAAIAAVLKRSLENDGSPPAEVAARALGVCLLARRTGSGAAALPIACTGLDATDQEGESWRPDRDALLAVCVAEVHAAAGHRLDALGMLRRARTALDGAQAPGPAAVYGAMLAAEVEGRLAEAGRDRMGAARAFAVAAERAATLLENGPSERAALGDVLADDVPTLLGASIVADAAAVRVSALLGRVRALVPAIGGGTGTAAARAAAREACDAVLTHGVPASVAPLDVVETLVALDPAEASTLADGLGVHGDAHDQPQDWQAVCAAASAHGALLRGDAETSAELYEHAGAAADDDATPDVVAFVRALDFFDNRDAEPELLEVFADEFLHALSELSEGAAAPPGARDETLLGAAIAAAVEHVATRVEQRDARVHLGLLLDLLREPRWLPVVPALHTEPAGSLVHAERAWELTLDRVGRILESLRSRPDTAVLVVQRVEHRTLFVMICASGEPISTAAAGAAYRDAVRALAGAGAGAAEGRRALDALPAPVHDLLRRHDRLLIVPDARVQDGTLPFSRMHDGQVFVREGRALEHASSLRDVLRKLEPREDEVTRLIDVFAQPEGDPTERLRSYEEVRASLGPDSADPRAAAALALTLAMTRLDAAEPAEAEYAIERLIAAADELDHRRAGALLRVVRARALARRDAEESRRLEAVDDALPWVASMRADGETWERLLRELGAERDMLALRVRMFDESLRPPAGL